MGVVADDVGQHLRPDDVEQRLAPVLEVVRDDLHDRVAAEAGPQDRHRHRRRPAAAMDGGLPVPEAQLRVTPPLGRDHGHVPAAGPDLVLDPGRCRRTAPRTSRWRRGRRRGCRSASPVPSSCPDHTRRVRARFERAVRMYPTYVARLCLSRSRRPRPYAGAIGQRSRTRADRQWQTRREAGTQSHGPLVGSRVAEPGGGPMSVRVSPRARTAWLGVLNLGAVLAVLARSGSSLRI